MAVLSTQRLSMFAMLARLALVVLLFASTAQSAFAQRKTTFYHNDALGSVVAASDESGQLLWRKEYAPFGEQLDSTAENEKLAFTGKEHDDLTGLTYFGARYYDPYLGRFIGVDPAGIDPSDPFTFNRYSYGNNNPYRFIDPDGQQSADTSCDEVCEEQMRRQARARPAAQVAEGASDIADVVDEEASSPWNWVGLGGGKKVKRVADELTETASKGIVAGRRVNMPAWKKITIDMEEVRSGHMVGGSRLGKNSKKDVFPAEMSETEVARAIRDAYRNGEVLQSQGADRVFVRGPFGTRSIEMWVNKTTKTIESAWPKS